MAHKTLIGGTAYSIKSGRTLVGGTAYSVIGGKTLVGGTAYEIGFGGGGGGGATVGNLAVGSSVYLNINEIAPTAAVVPTEFIVIHQGLPDATLYDTSCDGTWLLMKNIYLKTNVGTSLNYGTDATVEYALNTGLLGKFDANIQAAIKQVKIPYVNGVAYDSPIASKGNGLSTKLFFLGGYEVGFTTSTDSQFPIDGACLDYFNGTAATDTKRIAYYNGTATKWWLRSIRGGSAYWTVSVDGGRSYDMFLYSCGYRPALILPKELAYDENFNVIP